MGWGTRRITDDLALNRTGSDKGMLTEITSGRGIYTLPSRVSRYTTGPCPVRVDVPRNLVASDFNQLYTPMLTVKSPSL
jgi:hypothetical protein